MCKKNKYMLYLYKGLNIGLFLVTSLAVIILYEKFGYKWTSIPLIGYYPNERDSLRIVLKYLPLLLLVGGILIVKEKMKK